MIKWYHKRWFWGVVIFVFFIFFSFLYYKTLQGEINSIIDFITSVFVSAPAGFVIIFSSIINIQYPLKDIMLTWIVFYPLLLITLLFTTFYKPRVNIWYPIMFIIIFTMSMLFGMLSGAFN